MKIKVPRAYKSHKSALLRTLFLTLLDFYVVGKLAAGTPVLYSFTLHQCFSTSGDFAPRVYLAMSGDICGCQNQVRGVAPGI